MKTYRNFKINEADEVADPTQTLVRQIDALFDELKKKLTDLENPQPRKSWGDRMQSWLAANRHKYEWHSLHEYKAINEYLQNFREDVNVADVSKVLDEYKEKLKHMVQGFMAAYKPPRKPRTPKPEETPAANNPPADTSSTPKVEPTPTVVPPNKVDPTPTAVSPPTKVEPTPVAATPPPKKVEPTPAAATPPPKVEPTPTPTVPPKKVEPTPAAVTPPQKPAQSGDDEEVKLMKLGAAVLMARDMTGRDDVTPEEVEMAAGVPFNHEKFMSSKKHYIDAAREYQQSQANAGVSAGPKKDTMDTSGVSNPQPQKAPIEEKVWPTKSELISMSPQEFKDYIEENDPGLITSYEHKPHWWYGPGSDLRKELVAAHLEYRGHRGQNESLRRKVNVLKEMLRKSNRPAILIYEAAKVPFSERVAFYKKKLSYRDTSSAT